MRWLLIAILVLVVIGTGVALLSRGERETPSTDEPSAREARPEVLPAPAPSAAPTAAELPDEERRLLEMRELVRANRVGEARARAREYLLQYPHGRLRAEVENYTGVRLRPGRPDAQ